MIVSGSGQIDIANANVGATLISTELYQDFSVGLRWPVFLGACHPPGERSTDLKERRGTRNLRTGSAVECWSGRRTG